MDKKGIEVIRQHALKLYPDTGEASVDHHIKQQREAYVKGFQDGVRWLDKEISIAMRASR